jgi:pimeloyl-ACP methyl ester carboxylesterase
MLTVVQHGENGPLIVLLHWLGGSAHTWDRVAAGLAEAGFRAVALDLPGFGGSAEIEGYRVEEMASQVISTVRELRGDEPWLLAGHSMGGKVAAVVARAALDGAAGLEHLAGLVLVSPSPAGPEPMSEKKRNELLESLGSSTRDADEDRRRAGKFLDENTGKLALAPEVRRAAEADLLRMHRGAFAAWLTGGSKEDWSGRVGALPLPTLVLAGTEDSDLGPDAQRQVTLPHLPSATLVALEGCGHLAPLERPEELADRIAAFARELDLPLASQGSELANDFRDLLESSQTSRQTRAVMEARLRETPAQPGAFDAEQSLTLRALVRRVVPGAGFDIPARIDRRIASGEQDGWRFDVLPPDATAWQRGLASLDAAARRAHVVTFAALDAERQDGLLAEAREGKLGRGVLGALHIGESSDAYDAAGMQRWFEDARAEIVRTYVADPRTMQRIGFTGFADEAGFTQITLQATA